MSRELDCTSLIGWINIKRAFAATTNAIKNGERTLSRTRAERTNSFRATRLSRVLSVRSERVLSLFASPWAAKQRKDTWQIFVLSFSDCMHNGFC